MKSILLLLSFFITINSSFAMKNTINFIVIDDFIGDYISGVQVFDEQNNLIGITDSEGLFRFTKQKELLKLRFTKKNYFDTIISIKSKIDSEVIKMKLHLEITEKLNQELTQIACKQDIISLVSDSLIDKAKFEIEGKDSLFNFLFKEIRYPEFAIEYNIQGRVDLQFIVENNGKISCISIQKGASYILNKEAIRVIKEMPKWIPAQKNGVAVRSVVSLPINFKIQ